MSDTKTYSISELQAFMNRALTASNISENNAAAVARALTKGEIDGHKGHGLSRIPSYTAQAKSGKIDGHGTPEARRCKSSVLAVDARTGFAYPAFELIYEALPEIVRETGIGAAGVFNSNHFGVAGHHVEALAERGLVAMVVGNSPKCMAPWGGKVPLFGTNPIAFASPRKGEAPFVLDLALTRVNRAGIVRAAKEGQPIPEGWALDKDGNPTTDADAALAGTMIPIGGAKGAGLAIMVEILAAALTSAHFGFEATSFFESDGPSSNVGQYMIAIDPGAIGGPDSYFERIETLLGMIESEPGVRLPGSRRFRNRARAEKEGIAISSALVAEIEGNLTT